MDSTMETKKISSNNTFAGQHKQSIFWEVDNIVINSLEMLVDIINQEYNIPEGLPVKTLENVKDIDLKSINKNITREDIRSIVQSKEFWGTVFINRNFELIFSEEILKGYSHYFLIKNTRNITEQKKNFLKSNFKFIADFSFLEVPYEEEDESICFLVIPGDIIISDNIKTLLQCDSDTGLKILYTNNIETEYNNAFGKYANEKIEDIYIANTLMQIKDILEFNLQYPLHNL